MKDTDKTEEQRTLADRLREAREKVGLSAQEMAQRLEVPHDTYAAWEEGTQSPDTDTVRQAASILHVTGNYLLFGLSREGMVGAMFPNKATPAVLPGWYGCRMAGAALLFCGGAGMLLMAFLDRGRERTSAIISYLPFQIFLAICSIGAVLCIVSSILLHSRDKKKKRVKEQRHGKETNK
ncbi:MAG: helix-turn-helix transcriptional regulator [Clostridiales bacterium]|nr:helix-turn-helix transcriptional regulator [Clostridiales bacterium]